MAFTKQAQSYIDRLAALNYDEPHFDENKVIKHIQRHYELLNVACPEIVVADNMVAGYQVARRAAKRAARGDVRDAAWNAAWNAARGAAWGAAWDAAWNAARGDVRDAAWNTAWDTAWNAAWNAAWVTGFTNTGLDDPAILKYIEIDTEIFKALEAGLGFFFPMKDKLILVPVPRMVIAGDRLHYDQGKAVEWGDGTGFYFLHGVKFEEDLYNKIINETITAEEVLAIENSEQRMAAMVMLRPDRLLEQMNAKLVHTGKKGTKLYQVDDFMDTGETEYCMLMVCPSTGRQYVEWVEPEVGAKHDADYAQATALGVDLEAYFAMKEA